MLHFGLNALLPGREEFWGNTEKLLAKTLKLLPVLLGAGLAACSQPLPPVVMAPPPPPPVGHPYQVMVDVPAPTRHIRITSEQQQEVQQAFNVIALKSALMVAALTCNQQDQYDQFMTAFQPHVLDEQHVMDKYFRRIGGYYGQAREDDFVTLLANNQSVGGISQGGMFCLNNVAEYKAVLALRTDSDLDNFVTDLAPGAPAVAAAGPVITKLAPQESDVHVAVVQSTRHIHLVRPRRASPHLAESRSLKHSHVPSVGGNTARPVAVADTSASKPLSVAAAGQ